MEIVKTGIEKINASAGCKSLIAETLYKPDPAKVDAFLAALNPDRDIIYCAETGNGIAGILIISRTGQTDYEIKSISVDTGCRNSGIARKLIYHFQSDFPEIRITAETDDDAVGFYRNVGFRIEPLGRKYEGTERYRCVLDHSCWYDGKRTMSTSG